MIGSFELLELVIIIVAVVGSAVIKNGVGVGAGIFLLPFLSLILEPKVALGLGAPAMLISDIVGVRIYWLEWDKKELMLLVPFALLGVVLGALVVKATPNEIFKFWVGIFAIGVSAYNLYKQKFGADSKKKGLETGITDKENKKLTSLFGFLGGAASTIIHAGGMIMSIYLLHRRKEKRAFVGTFILFFAIINTSKMVSYVGIGILSASTMLLVLALAPLIVVGGLTGNALNKRIPQETFRAIVLVIIFLIGVRLLMS